MIKRFRNNLKRYIKEVLEIKTTPHEIALGFSIGTAIAVLPTFGLGVFIGLVVILVYKRISKISMFIAFAFWNPIVLIPLTALSYGLGDIILNEPSITFKYELLNQGFIYSRKYLLGNFIITLILTLVSYILIYKLSYAYQKKQIPLIT